MRILVLLNLRPILHIILLILILVLPNHTGLRSPCGLQRLRRPKQREKGHTDAKEEDEDELGQQDERVG